MPNLLHHWSEITDRLQDSRRIALFLDFDGTLAEIQSRPEDVWLDENTRRILHRLARSPRFHLWIVSGRRQADIKTRIGVPGIRYLGLHGWEGRPNPGVGEEAVKAMECVKSWMGGLLINIPGAWIEDKGLVVAIHYREASVEDIRLAHEAVKGVTAPFNGTLKIVQGKKVLEVSPSVLEDKGAAVTHELASVCPNAVPIYIGDDLVDEPAFAALAAGITICVGPAGTTKAAYRLASVSEVQRFLEKLVHQFARPVTASLDRISPTA